MPVWTQSRVRGSAQKQVPVTSPLRLVTEVPDFYQYLGFQLHEASNRALLTPAMSRTDLARGQAPASTGQQLSSSGLGSGQGASGPWTSAAAPKPRHSHTAQVRAQRRPQEGKGGAFQKILYEKKESNFVVQGPVASTVHQAARARDQQGLAVL